MYYYIINVAGNDKCVATSPTYPPKSPISVNCLNDLDYPDTMTIVGKGFVICTDVAGNPQWMANVYSDGAAAVVAVPAEAVPRAPLTEKEAIPAKPGPRKAATPKAKQAPAPKTPIAKKAAPKTPAPKSANPKTPAPKTSAPQPKKPKGK